jgi:hypothetical protein
MGHASVLKNFMWHKHWEHKILSHLPSLFENGDGKLFCHFFSNNTHMLKYVILSHNIKQ